MRRTLVTGMCAVLIIGGGCATKSALHPTAQAEASVPATVPPVPMTEPTAETTTTTTRPYVPPATEAPVVTLTNPEDLNYALEREAQQLMGMNVTNESDVQAFINWYHSQEIAFQTHETNVEPPTTFAAARTWIMDNYRTQVEAYGFLQAGSAVNCMIQNGGPGPCPT